MCGSVRTLTKSILKCDFILNKFKHSKKVVGSPIKWDIVAGEKRHFSQESPNIINSPLGDIEIPDMPFHEFIFHNWSKWERKTALICGETGKKFTYRKVRTYSINLADALRTKFKIAKNDCFAIILLNCPEYPIIMLAASICGAIPTTVNPAYTVEEIVTQLENCQAKLIFTEVQSYEHCAKVAKKLNLLKPIIVVQTNPALSLPDGGVDINELFDQSCSNLKPVPFNQQDVLVLPYSSGTTGHPKGVLLTHKSVVANLTQINNPGVKVITPATTFHQDSVFGILPMFHIYGMVIVCFYSLVNGCRLVTIPRFHPRLYISNVIRKKVNVLYVVPPIIFFLSNKLIRPKYFKNLTYIINAASPIIQKDAIKVKEKAKHIKIVQGYGMTEASPALSHTSHLRIEKMTSIGIPVASTKLKISDLETGEPLPQGKHGEICAYGPQLMKGYLNNPESTKEVFDKDGWLKTGDIGYYDEDGDFFIVERLKDLIKVKGFQVAPAEVEEVIRTHPKVSEVAVVGVPDEDQGEAPRAFIVLEKQMVMTEKEVQDYVKDKLSAYKQLKGGIRFIDSLPKNNIGKVLRKELKKLK